MIPLKIIIVDDEWLVREELKKMLAPYTEIEVVGEAANVPQAVDLIQTRKPDAIFLDIQMAGATGFDLLEKTEINAEIIFVTAYDQYAIKAFEVNALDYLPKPVNKDRLAQTIQRLVSRERAVAPANQKLGYDDVAYVLVNGALKFVKISSLMCIVAEGNYSYFYSQDRRRDLVSKTLQEWEEILPGDYFIRIHRSTIVNFEWVTQVKRCPNYTYLVYVNGIGKPFIMSRRYAARLKKILPF